MRFSGVLLIADKPSTKPPSGARGHRILVTKGTLRKSIKSLIGAPLWASSCLSKHDRISNRVGTIHEATLDEDFLIISGEIDRSDDRFLSIQASQETLGLSFDALDCTVKDMRERVWVLDSVNLIGATVLYRRKASFRKDTIFWLNP